MSTSHPVSGSMQDGRFMSVYDPSCGVNAKLAKEMNVSQAQSTKFRHAMQTQGLSVLRSEAEASPCGSLACADLGASTQDPSSSSEDGPVPYDPASLTAEWK